MTERCKHDHLMVRVHDSHGWDLPEDGLRFDLPEGRRLEAYCYDCNRRWPPKPESESPRWLRERYEALVEFDRENAETRPSP